MSAFSCEIEDDDDGEAEGRGGSEIEKRGRCHSEIFAKPGMNFPFRHLLVD